MIIEIDIRIEDSDGRILHRFENKYDDKVSAFKESQDYTDDVGMDFCDFFSEYLSCSGAILREKLFQGNYTMKRDRSKRKVKKSTTSHRNEFNHDNEINPNSKVTHLEDSELEYRIRIGDDKVLVCKIPLKLQPSTTSVTLQLKEDVIAHPEIRNTFDTDTEPDVKNNYVNGFEKSNDYDNIQDNKFESKVNQIELDQDKQYDIDIAPEIRNKIDEVNNYPDDIDKTLDSQSDISTYNAVESDTEIDSILNYAMMKAIEKYELNLAPSCDA